MNNSMDDMFGEDVRQTHVVVDDVDVLYSPHENMAYFEIRFIGRRKRRSGEWGKKPRIYRCYLRPDEINKILTDINQYYGGNITRVAVLDQTEPEENSEEN